MRTPRGPADSLLCSQRLGGGPIGHETDSVLSRRRISRPRSGLWGSSRDMSSLPSETTTAVQPARVARHTSRRKHAGVHGHKIRPSAGTEDEGQGYRASTAIMHGGACCCSWTFRSPGACHFCDAIRMRAGNRGNLRGWHYASSFRTPHPSGLRPQTSVLDCVLFVLPWVSRADTHSSTAFAAMVAA
jgi:hypothetical protein